MKTIRILSLSFLVIMYGFPVTVFAQTIPEMFSLPDGAVGQQYNANIEAVLRDKYHLKLETDARTSVFRSAVLTGELPAGLFLRANGTIIGTPRAARDGLYQFQRKAVDIAVP